MRRSCAAAMHTLTQFFINQLQVTKVHCNNVPPWSVQRHRVQERLECIAQSLKITTALSVLREQAMTAVCGSESR